VTTVSGGTLNVTGSLANNGSASVIVNGIISATAAESLAAAPAIVRTRAAAASYAGYGSTIGTNDSFGGAFKTKADLLGGSNLTGPSESVSMQWRGRASEEAPLQAPGSLFPLGGGLASDVINLTGMSNGGAGTGDGRVQTDVFVLQMTYNPAAITAATNRSEANAATAGLIALGYLNLGTNGVLGGTSGAADSWVNAITGNFGSNIGSTNVQGTWAGAGGSTLVLGSWGVNIADDTVWAVINHNSQYAVIPEPTTVTGLIGLAGLFGLSRRRRA